MVDCQHVLKENRKQVCWKDFHDIREKEDELWLTYRLHAADVDEQHYLAKKLAKT